MLEKLKVQLKTYQHLQINGLIENRLAFYDKGGEIKLNVYQQEIYKTIDTLTEEKLKQLGFDKTKRGKVISVDSTTCIVEIDGDNYTCKLRKGIYIQPNDIVFVKFPQNNNVDKYVDTVLGGNEIPEYLVISAEEILTKLKTVDGEGSGLDADMLDGKHGNEFATKEDIAGISIDGDTIVQNINSSTAIIDDKNLSENVNDSILKKHDHPNKTILDTVTQTKIDNWDTVGNKSDKEHIHSESDITDLDKYTKAEIDTKLNVKADKTYVDSGLANKVDKITGKQLSTEDYTTVDKTKLSGIEEDANKYIHPTTHSLDMITETTTKKIMTDIERNKLTNIEDGAEKNKVNSVNSKTGDIVINKVDIGLGDVENKSSTTIRNEITNTNITNALGYTPENSSNKGVANGYAPLDSNVKIPLSMLPDIAKQQTYVVETITDRDNLTGLIMGEKCYITTLGDSYIWDGIKWVTLAKADWENVNLQWTNIVGKPQSNVADIDDATSKRHTHSNKSIIDTITQTLIDRWNSAWNHISDAIRHITSGERAKWNTVDDKADSTYVSTELNKKVDKVTGKQLSTEDFTTIEKTKLSNIEAGANKYTLPNATTTVLGGIKVGANLSIAEDGTLSAVDDDSKSTFIVKQELFTATEGQTLFNLTKGHYQPNTNTISVYLYGGKQPNIALNEISSSSFEITEPLKTGDVVLVEYIELSSATPYPVHGSDHLTGGYDPIPKATTSSDGLMAKEDKDKLNNIEADANKYTHPNTHSISMITETTDKKILTATERSKIAEIDNKIDKVSGKGLSDENYTLAEKNKLAGIATGANKYVHPSTHPASMITESPTRRFTSDVEKADWNSAVEHIGDGIRHITSAERTKWNAKAEGIHKHKTADITDFPTEMTPEYTAIPSNADLNDYTEIGFYGTASSGVGSTVLNKPTEATGFTLIVAKRGSYTTQILIDWILYSPYMWIRSWSSSWGNWYKVPFDGDIPTKLSQLAKDINFDERYYTESETYTKTEVNTKLNGKVDNSRVLTDVPTNAKFTDTTYSEITTAEIDAGTANTLRAITGRRIKYILDKIATMISSLTKSDVGLGNVDNTSDLNKPISTAIQTALNSKVDNSRVLANVPADAKFTDTIYTHPSNHPASMITESATRRFVSDTEKSSWNSKAQISDIPTKVGQLSNDKSYVTSDELGSAGYGDMVRSVYDTNNNGIVDNAEKVNGHTVESDVPANAKFTDTIYTHPSTHPASMITGLHSVATSGIADKLNIVDTRSTNSPPSYYFGQGKNMFWEFKYRTSIGNPPTNASASGTYAFILTITGWGDSSGGYPVQISVGGQNIAIRQGISTTAWGSWYVIANIEDLPTKLSELQLDTPMYHVGTTPPSNNNLLWINTNL